MVFNLYLIFISNRKSFFRIFCFFCFFVFFFVFVFDLYVMEKVRINFILNRRRFFRIFFVCFCF